MADQHSTRSVQVVLKSGYVVIVDEADAAFVLSFTWTTQAGKCGARYAYRPVIKADGQRGKVYLHRELVCAARGQRVDHVNGNGLDNRRSNLRLCTNAENMRNMRRGRGASKYKGVAWFARDGCWRAYIVQDARQIHLGYFATEIEAALAYDRAARERFGEFAKLNLPDRGVA